ncbi:hypothetical protein GJ744_000661 [Endocarpon pusillum]|uniref:DNA polymerase delta subunit 4 n=1 Tax=Endocarpon pusillum TaxID=364733 RepID=A0A8H7AED7_9EURO|nr:hypothetical protein GJ744_000661 [Endocarpon pusillum]
MPPTRRKSAQSSGHAQHTLSFHSKPTKVIKSTGSALSTKKSSKVGSALIEAITEDAPTSEVALRQQIKKEAAKPKDEADLRAEKVTDAQIKKYWRKEEEVRKAPRVHQQDLTIHEKILRHFDLCSQFGPCIGITRAKRWKRANSLGLDPPIEVLAVLVREQEKARGKEWLGQRAYLDELMSSHYVVD